MLFLPQVRRTTRAGTTARQRLAATAPLPPLSATTAAAVSKPPSATPPGRQAAGMAPPDPQPPRPPRPTPACAWSTRWSAPVVMPAGRPRAADVAGGVGPGGSGWGARPGLQAPELGVEGASRTAGLRRAAQGRVAGRDGGVAGAAQQGRILEHFRRRKVYIHRAHAHINRASPPTLSSALSTAPPNRHASPRVATQQSRGARGSGRRAS